MGTLYKKVGRKYVACGINERMHLENGNWLLIVNGNATSYVKVSDGANLSMIATEKALINKLVDVAAGILKSGESLYDSVEKVVKTAIKELK